MHKLISKTRWKQIRGRIHRAWGRWTHDPSAEFFGEREIMEAKIEAFQARSLLDTHHRRPASRRATRHVVPGSAANRGLFA